MPFKDTNTFYRLPPNGELQVGRSNGDQAEVVEQDVSMPWAASPQASYVYYECTVGVMLDSGIVVHNRLPQVNRAFDTLASADASDPAVDKITGLGVNLRCQDQYRDIVQRMGHSRYWFRLWGQALRVGYQVPIPGIRFIGGVPAIPYDKNPQWAYNTIAPGGNYSGVILWRAQWSLWYTTSVQPANNDIPVADPSAHIVGTAPIPRLIQSPYTRPDDNATTGTPTRPDFLPTLPR